MDGKLSARLIMRVVEAWFENVGFDYGKVRKLLLWFGLQDHSEWEYLPEEHSVLEYKLSKFLFENQHETVQGTKERLAYGFVEELVAQLWKLAYSTWTATRLMPAAFGGCFQ